MDLFKLSKGLLFSLRSSTIVRKLDTKQEKVHVYLMVVNETFSNTVLSTIFQ